MNTVIGFLDGIGLIFMFIPFHYQKINGRSYGMAQSLNKTIRSAFFETFNYKMSAIKNNI